MAYDLSYKTLRSPQFVTAVHKVINWAKYSTKVRVKVAQFWKPLAEAGETCDILLRELRDRDGKQLPSGEWEIPDQAMDEFHLATATVNGPRLKSHWISNVELSPADLVALSDVIEDDEGGQ
jgi:hypothetical protein